MALDSLAAVVSLLKVSELRRYRIKFSKPYRQQFESGKLYRWELIDAARQGVDCIVLNNKKYRVDFEVIEQGKQLVSAIQSLQSALKNEKAPASSAEENGPFELSEEVKCSIKDFETHYIIYEENFVKELMEIERTCK